MKKLNRQKVKCRYALAMSAFIVSVASFSYDSHAAPVYALLDATDKPLPATGGTLRATVPFPDGFPQINDTTTERLAVIDSDGSYVPVQTNVVTRTSTGDVAVAEITAVVKGASSLGEPAGRYKLTDIPANQEKPSKNVVFDANMLAKMHPAVIKFFSKKTLWLQAVGPKNEKYFCNLLEVPAANIKIDKSGIYEQRISVTCNLKPLAPAPQVTLPRLLTVMAFITATRENPVVNLTLMYGNANVSPYVGNVYFRDLWLVVPGENVVLNDLPIPSYNSTPTKLGGYTFYQIVKPQADGTQYSIPPLAWRAPRILAITTPEFAARATSELQLAGQASAVRAKYDNVDTFSWENPNTPHFVMGRPLPKVDFIGNTKIRDKWKANFAKLRSTLEGGVASYPFETGVLGDVHPYGVAYGGATGGSEISQTPEGATGLQAGAVDAIRWTQYVLGAYLDRMPGRFPIMENGEPWSVDSALVSCAANNNLTGYAQRAQFSPTDGVPVNLTQDDPLNINASKIYDFHRVAAKKPAYESTLLAYKPIDFQHLVRFLSKLNFLMLAKNDPVAKYLLRATAENARASMTIYAKNSSNCAPLNSTLLFYHNSVQDKPGRGTPMGRAHADITQLMVNSYAAGDDAWRNKIRPWINVMTDTSTKAQIACSGFTQASALAAGKGLPDYTTNNYHIMQSIEEARLEGARVITEAFVYAKYDNARAEKLRNARLLYYQGLKNPAYTVEGTYIPQKALVYDSATDTVICPNVNLLPNMLQKGNAYEQPNAALAAHDMTGEKIYLDIANSIMPGTSDLKKDLQNSYTSSTAGTYYINPWTAIALYLIQKKEGD